jgi:hypothetical protein
LFLFVFFSVSFRIFKPAKVKIAFLMFLLFKTPRTFYICQKCWLYSTTSLKIHMIYKTIVNLPSPSFLFKTAHITHSIFTLKLLVLKISLKTSLFKQFRLRIEFSNQNKHFLLANAIHPILFFTR